MTFYDTQPRLFPRMGKLSERPIVPPDKQCLFWDYEHGVMYGVNDSMQWIQIGIDTVSVQSFSALFSYLQAPNYPFMRGIVNARFLRVRLEIITAWSPGTTISIGDALDVDRLMTIDDNSPGSENIYEVELEAETSQDIRAYIGGTPMYGQAKIHLIYDSEGFLPLVAI